MWVLCVVRCIGNKPAYFAKRLYDAMHGLGTNDDSLIRTVISRCEIDMVQIKQEFEKNYKQPLAKFIAVRHNFNNMYILSLYLAYSVNFYK